MDVLDAVAEIIHVEDDMEIYTSGATNIFKYPELSDKPVSYTHLCDVLPEVAVYSIVNSLVEGTEASKVQITVNGESNAVYMEKVDLSKPLKADMDWTS